MIENATDFTGKPAIFETRRIPRPGQADADYAAGHTVSGEDLRRRYGPK